ncbi:hypothetical protein ABZT26_25615 [Streptomyces sp. NPDC005395]|uniref:hypothetical protein n=1 Tax=Streptomyces sp. NPDC005395 TaxID=3157042 RepID=UPI0033BF7DB8
MARGSCGCRPWPVDTTCCRDWPGADAPEEDRRRAERALAIASDRLRKLTAGRWGLCEEVIRPCDVPSAQSEQFRRWEAQSLYGSVAGGSYDASRWVSGMRPPLCGCSAPCSCADVCKVVLPGPADSVLAVKVDGQVLPTTAYTLTPPPDGWLIRTDGRCWPETQDVTRPDTEPGTFSVRYLRGRDPEDDFDAIRAVSALACELYRSMCGQKCRIQGRVRSIQREGVSYDMVDDWPPKGTGLSEVDEWLALANPWGHVQQPQVFTLDLPMNHFHGGRDC